MTDGFITSKNEKMQKMVQCDKCKRISAISDLKEIIVNPQVLGFNMGTKTVRWCDECIDGYNAKKTL